MFKFRKNAVAAVIVLAFILLAGCKKEKQVVILGAADTITAQTIAEIYAQAMEAKNYRVERRFSMASQGGDEHSLHHALKNGHIDLYAGYTGDETFMFGKQPAKDPYSIYDALKVTFEEEGITLLEPVPANNAYTLVMLTERAAAENIKTYADILEKADGFTIAVTNAFESGKEGFNALKETYGAFSFAKVIIVNEDELYAALDNAKAGIAVARSNDGLLSDSKYKALRDNFHAFVPQVITPVVKKAYIDNNPEIRDILNKISVGLNDKEVIDLNRSLAVLNKDYKEIAKQYLSNSGLLKK
jgi:osmoprotectant transport system substrate-binding protein